MLVYQILLKSTFLFLQTFLTITLKSMGWFCLAESLVTVALILSYCPLVWQREVFIEKIRRGNEELCQTSSLLPFYRQ